MTTPKNMAPPSDNMGAQNTTTSIPWYLWPANKPIDFNLMSFPSSCDDCPGSNPEHDCFGFLCPNWEVAQ